MTPGSTTATRSSGLISFTRFMSSTDSTTPPRTGKQPPVSPLPAPRGVQGTRCSAHSRSTIATSSVERQRTATSAGNGPAGLSSRA